jgi:2-isopropylmalate synthase
MLLMTQSIEIYDTTLRDGGQGLGVNLSLADKLELTRKLDWLGVAYIEGGWPGSNPKDAAYFSEVRGLPLKHAQIAAFGSTRHAKNLPSEDPNLQELVLAKADACCIFGKAWDLHVHEALRVTLDENLEMIQSSLAFLRQATGKPVLFDAEHFFDGFIANPEYAIACLKAAVAAGTERVILCDTNGGMLPENITQAIAQVRAAVGSVPLGIHVHNDGGLAVANTLAAVQAGCTQVQGTINGIGERCGNVDLTTVIANLELKMQRRALPDGHLARLTDVSRFVWERLNLTAPLNQPLVGKSAFAHKGGIHVSAMQRNQRTYEHISPESVGNTRQILISELSGRSNVLAKLSSRYPELSELPILGTILNEIQSRENQGYSYEAADASFELLVKRFLEEWTPAFQLSYYRVHGIGAAAQGSHLVEATVKLEVRGTQQLCVAEGNGPVDALSQALLASLRTAYPELEGLQLVDYKVRVVNSTDGTAAKVRVLIEHAFGGVRFATLGVSANIIEASWQALVDAVEYAVTRGIVPREPAAASPRTHSALVS